MIALDKAAQYRAMTYAKKYSAAGRSAVALVWLKRLARMGPLSPIQAFNLKKYFDESILEDLGLIRRARCRGEETAAALAKRYGPN